MVVSIGHFDTDQDEFVIEGRLHNGAAVPGSSDDWEQWVTKFRGAPHDIDREYHRIEHQSRLDRQIIDRPAAHPRDEYSLMMKMKTPYQMASIRPPRREYETLKTIAADASQLTLPPQNELGSSPLSIRRYSGPSDGQPLSFVIIYETGHIAVHARENCAYEGQYQFVISDDAVSDLVGCVYESGFGSLSHTYLGSKDSLAATSLGFCAGTNQQWVYAYKDSLPNAFTTVDDAVRSASRIDLFETGDHETITSTLTSGRPAAALSLLAQNTALIEELPHEAVLAGIETGIQSDPDRTKYTALEVLSNVQSTVPDRLWEAVCTIESDHPDLIQKVTSTTTVVAATKPELVDDLAAPLLETLRTDDPRRRTAALESLKSVSEHQPRVLIDALPAIETILKDGRTSDQRTALDAVLSLAKAEPEHVEPLASALLTFIDERTLPIRSSAIVGHLAKVRPDVAVPAIETFGEWLDAEEPRIRANGLAVLADLAGTYPERLRRYAPRAREFLLDDDELVKYNATSILARVATVDPDAVEPATDSLRDALSVDHPPTQQNACWALGRIGAHESLSELETLREHTDVEDVRAAATAGAVLLSLSECPRCGERIRPHQVSVAVYENMKARWECPKCDYSTVVPPT
ncbi:hypothetical protein D3D02_15890 [Halobellus sp. Atlit-38R]|uniref:HEAT repeat domain-containing protein n=1 Tax=Halobellus sp. Atlit-38R TaxID=2282131 RepID=UPI000EF26592|nr:HEAT repeat domain-containing protein [Halobellus sp. Atlit-38R]RLM83969.1 hypothetical protein D3D02_15890 [Halobellus sp. Atlit-38R]